MSMKLEAVFREFLEMNPARTRNTQRSRSAIFSIFINFLTRRLKREPIIEDFTAYNVREYLIDYLESGKSTNTINIHLIYLRMVANMCPLIPEDHRRAINFLAKYPKTPAPERILEDDDIIKIQLAVKKLSPTPWEYRKIDAILALMLGVGLRASELLSLRMWQFDDDFKNIIRVQVKQGTRHCKYIPAGETRGALIEFLKEREKCLQFSTGYKNLTEKEKFNLPVFLKSPAPDLASEELNMSYWQLRGLMRNLKKESGVKFSAHWLRHACARKLIKATGDLTLVQQQLDHKSIQSTLFYTKVTAKEHEERMENALKKVG